MNVTKDVMQDLVVIYLSGEASADTRQLVEEYLAGDPEMAAHVKASQATAIPFAAPPPDLERRALEQTRRLLARKNTLLWLAMFLSYLPVSFTYNPGEATVHFLYLDKPAMVLSFLIVAAAGWAAFLKTCRRLQATGLEPVRGWRRRIAWSLGGMAASAPLMIFLGQWTGRSLFYNLIPICGIAAVAIGEKLGQLSERRVEPPITLFGKDRDRRS